MSANPQRLQNPAPASISQLRPVPKGNTLGPFMLRFLRLLRLSFWRAFEHDAFAIAKASAYSSILTFFPALLVVGAVLATSHRERFGAGIFEGNRNATAGGAIGHHLAAYRVDRIRGNDFLDGRFPPLL
jgi:hypothetical protein